MKKYKFVIKRESENDIMDAVCRYFYDRRNLSCKDCPLEDCICGDTKAAVKFLKNLGYIEEEGE